MFKRSGKATAMKKAIALILIFLLLDGPDNVVLLSEMFSPPEAEAANWMCGQDLNGNGYVGDPGETAQCISTSQGQLCPISSVNCPPVQTCPLGSYPCSGGACTQTGTCSAVQVQLTQYQCPITGQTYSDQTTCDNNCLQTASCAAPTLSGNSSFPVAESSQCGFSWFFHPASYISTIAFSGSGNQFAVTGTYTKPDSNSCDGPCGDSCSYSRTSNITVSSASLSGSASFPVSETSQCGGSWFYRPSATISSVSFSGSGAQLTITSTYTKPDSNNCDGPCGDSCSYTKTSDITVSGANLSGSASFPVSEASQCGVSWFVHPTASISSLSLSGSGNALVISATYTKPDSNNCDGPCGDACSYARTSPIYFGGGTCPLTGGSACSGSPSTCTAKQPCTGTSNTATKYQCSLTGVQYDTLSQCTAGCSKNATCVNGYVCPLGSQYSCMNNSGVMQCSSNQCVDLDTNPGDITHVDDTMLQNDGARDASGNCLGTIYIFTGRGMRCRKPGVSDGFHNCCDNDSDNVMTDSTGTMSELNTAISAIQTIYQMAQVAYYVNAILTTGVTPAGLATASEAVQSAVYAGVMGQSVEAGLQAYAAAFINPATIAIAVVLYLVMQFLMKSCDQQDIETGILDSSGYCHYVGEYCEKKWPIIGCVQKAKGYCCFNSKIGRIIQEQGRPQLLAFQPNGAWGSSESPNCRGFTPEEFEMLDFSKIDLSEYFGDIQKDMAEKLQNMGTNATQKIQQFYQDIR